MQQRSELKSLNYAQNAPKILLEVISARSALVILAATYLVFIACFAYDVNSTAKNFSGGINVVGTEPCQNLDIDETSMWSTGGKWGCTLAPYVNDDDTNPGVWVGRVGNLSNVISVALRFNKRNISALNVGNNTFQIKDVENSETFQDILSAESIDYDLNLYACFHEDICMKNSGDRRHKWHSVLDISSTGVALDMFSEDFDIASHSICGNTFQNQESLPTKGLVRSYFAIVKFWGNGVHTVIDKSDDSSSISEYEFLTISRTTWQKEYYIRPVLMVITFFIALSFIWVSYRHNMSPSTWLRERKWIVFYFFALIVYQNPAYIVISVFHESSEVPSSSLVFLTYSSDAFAQASFFLIWLLFADGSSSGRHLMSFYLPKLLLTTGIFMTNMAILTMQFTSLYSEQNVSSPTLAVYNWSQRRKVLFISFSLSFLFLLIVWSFVWYHTLSKTSRTLQMLPYMSTRYLQLSFRFFSLQATLVAIYYLFEYGVVIFLILRNSPPVLSQHVNNISDNVNTLFRHQTLLVGKVIFLTVYSIILAVLYLPASDRARGAKVNEALSIISATYTIQEVEMNAVVKARRSAMKRKSALSNIADTKAEVFCVDLALLLLEASNEAYYDASAMESKETESEDLKSCSDESDTELKEKSWSERPVTPTGVDSDASKTERGESTQEGSYGVAQWEKIGYKIIAQKYHAAHDTYVYIGRHVSSGKIIVAFRGTSSTKHWKNNFQYGLKEIDFMRLPLTSVDEIDGLDVGQYINLDIHGVDSNDSDSDDDDFYDFDESVEMAQLDESGRGYRKRKRRKRSKKRSDDHDPVGFVADTVREVGGVVFDATSTVVGATTGLFTAAVAHTPILGKTMKVFVHSGFWECFIVVREFIHETLRMEMAISNPDLSKDVYFTGHSLGGVIASYAALDFTIYSKNRIDKFIRHQKLRHIESLRSRLPMAKQYNSSSYRSVYIGMYSFGAPKPGNWNFAHLYDKHVPNSFRIVVDGDIVCGLPPTMGYRHIGTQVVIDRFCSGSIIIDPSFVERRLRTSTMTSIAAHILGLYKESLIAVRDASMYIQQIGLDSARDDVSDGREDFNRAKREVDDAEDHFFLEKIYGLLNKSPEADDSFSPLPQESGHSAVAPQSIMDASVRNSSWSRGLGHDYDDTFTLNTSEHQESIDSFPSRARLFDKDNSLDNNPMDDDEDGEPRFLSTLTSSGLSLLKLPFRIVKNSANAVQHAVFGSEPDRIREDQLESMILMQRSSMRRDGSNGSEAIYREPFRVNLAPFSNKEAL